MGLALIMRFHKANLAADLSEPIPRSNRAAVSALTTSSVSRACVSSTVHTAASETQDKRKNCTLISTCSQQAADLSPLCSHEETRSWERRPPRQGL